MEILSEKQLIFINGGTDCDNVCGGQNDAPEDIEDKIGQHIGEAIGEAIGATIRQTGEIAEALWPF